MLNSGLYHNNVLFDCSQAEYTMDDHSPFKVFTKHYPDLCNTLTDIDKLLPHFVAENIIDHNDVQEIKALVTTRAKVQKLLTHIAGPLSAGNTKGFNVMLRIMEKYGLDATKQLAGQIRKSLVNKENHGEPDHNGK